MIERIAGLPMWKVPGSVDGWFHYVNLQDVIRMKLWQLPNKTSPPTLTLYLAGGAEIEVKATPDEVIKAAITSSQSNP